MQPDPSARPARPARPRRAPRPSRLSRWRRWRAGLAGAALLVVLALLTHPWWLASIVSAQLARSSGRDVAIGRIVVTWTPVGGLQVSLRDLDIANAAWADPAWPLIRAREMVARVALGQTLAQRRPVIRELVLRDARVDLERQADGLRSWRLRRPEDRSPGRYKVQALTAENSDVRFVHGGIGLALEARARPAGATVDAARPAAPPAAGDAAVDPALPTRITLRARWRGIDASGDFATGATLTFLETGERVPMRGRIDLPGVIAELDGEAGDLFRRPLVDARLSVRAAAVEPVRAAVRTARSRVASEWEAMRVPLSTRPPPAPARTAFSLDARLQVAPQRVAFESLQAHFGNSDLAGRIAWEQEGGGGVEVAVAAAASVPPRDAPEGSSGSTRAAASSASGASASSASSSAAVASEAAHTAAPSRSFRVTRLVVEARSERVAIEELRDLATGWSDRGDAAGRGAAGADDETRHRWPDADIRYVAGHARWGERAAARSFGPARLQATVRDQHLDLQVLELGLAGGRIEGRGTLDRASEPTRGEVTLQLRGLDLAKLLPQSDEKRRATGRIDGTVRARGQGERGAEWLASLDGRAELSLRDGTLPALIDAELGLQTLRIARSFLGAPSAVPLRCAALVVDVNDGQALVRRLVLDSDRTLTRGRGRIDLAARTLDLTLTGETKGRALLVLDRSIRLHGPLARPEHELVPRAAMPETGCRG